MLHICNFATKGDNCDGTDFKMGVSIRFSEYREWTLIDTIGKHVPLPEIEP